MSALLAGCKTFDAPLDDFTPQEFSRQQMQNIAETAALGPRIVEPDFGSTANRRIYIDENVVTDYTKIINKTFWTNHFTKFIISEIGIILFFLSASKLLLFIRISLAVFNMAG